MKRNFILLVALASMLTMLTPFARAEDTTTASIETFIDNLATKEDIRQYEFEMLEDGDAVIYVSGLQESWDGYPYHWFCTVYEADLVTVVAYANVRGYTDEYNGPAVISAADLTAGTYYIQMESVNSANPLMTKFTSDSYEITLVKAYASASARYHGDGVQTFQNAGDVLWAFDGTAFVKLNAGECFVALIDSASGAVVPMLIGTDEASVEYVVSSTGEKISSGGSWRDETSGIDYYYSQCSYIRQYTEKSMDTSAVPIAYFHTNRTKEAIERICNSRRDEMLEKEEAPREEPAEKTSWLKEHKGSIIAFGAVIVGVLVFGVISSDTTHSYDSYGSESGGGYGGTTSFDAESYVRNACGDYIFGVVSARDIARIDDDSSLTFVEKEAAKSELRHQADMNY